MRREVFSTPQPPRLDLRVASGEIEVETVDGDETTVEIEPQNDKALEIVDDATVTLSGDRLLVEIDPKRRIFTGRTPRVRLVVRAPHGSSLEARTAAADVVARGRYADADVKTASGDVTIGDVAGRLELNAVSGDVKVERVGGDAAVTTVSGNARLGEVAGDVRINSVSGDIDVQTIAGSRIDAKSVSGDMRLGVKRGASVFMDVRTVSGKTTSELEAQDGPPADGPTVELRAKSVSGDVRIVRG